MPKIKSPWSPALQAAGWHLYEATTNASIRVPVRLDLKGSRQNTHAPGKVVKGHYVRGKKLDPSNYTERSFWHVYDYTSFHVGAPNLTIFSRPCGKVFKSTNTSWNSTSLPAIACPGACGQDTLSFAPVPAPSPTPANGLPSLPKQFTAIIEANIGEHGAANLHPTRAPLALGPGGYPALRPLPRARPHAQIGAM